MIKKIILVVLIIILICTIAFFGYMIYTRLSHPYETTQPIVSETEQSQKAEITFSIQEETPAQTANKTPISCLGLAAEPSSGVSPLTVTFSGVSQNKTNKPIQFEFIPGDSSASKLISSEPNSDGIQFESYIYTYKTSGNYTAELIIHADNKTYSSEECTVTISSGGKNTAQITTPVSSNTSLTAIPTAGTLSPSKIPTAKPTVIKTPTRLPTSADSVPLPVVPEAGGFIPTVIAGLGGIVILALAVLL